MNDVDALCEEAELLKQLAVDSEYAFRVFYDRHHRRIYQLGMRYLNCSELAQEVVQEVFMKLWLNRTTVQGGKPIESWLFVVGRNDILNRIKKLSNETKVFDQIKYTQPDVDDTMQDKFKEAEYQSVLKKALNNLSEKQMQVYKMARFENLSYNQIAQHMDISPLTVKTHMSRALQNIRESINITQILAY